MLKAYGAATLLAIANLFAVRTSYESWVVVERIVHAATVLAGVFFVGSLIRTAARPRSKRSCDGARW